MKQIYFVHSIIKDGENEYDYYVFVKKEIEKAHELTEKEEKDIFIAFLKDNWGKQEVEEVGQDNYTFSILSDYRLFELQSITPINKQEREILSKFLGNYTVEI